MEIKLGLPLRDIAINQYFGNDFWYYDSATGESYWFYKHIGLPYHTGIDFAAKHRCPLYACNDGEVIRSGNYSDGGIGIEIQNDDYSTFYYHLDEVIKHIGDKVKRGDLIGYCDNTGRFTTGDHLHLELRIKGVKVNPAGYFFYTYNGVEINPKDWDRSRSYHRYYRGRPNGGLWIERYRVVPALTSYLKRLPTNEEINAATYGGWDRESIKNDAMYFIWSQLKKDEYNNGLKSFN